MQILYQCILINMVQDFSDNIFDNYNNTEKDFCDNEIIIILSKQSHKDSYK